MGKKNKPTVTVLGNTYVDIISGFEGICVGKATYLTGCDQSCLKPKQLNKDKDGPGDSHWFDDTLLVLKNGERFDVDTRPVGGHRRAGGPNADTPSR